MGGVDYGRAVHEGLINYLSPSAMTTGDPNQPGGCYRRYYIEYVLGIRSPFTGSQRLGVETHGQIERHLLTGEMVLGRLALSAREYIPEPDPTTQKVELDIQPTLADANGKFLGWPGPPILAAAGVRVVGHIDLLRLPDATGNLYSVDPVGDTILDGHALEVKDWKTTSDVGRWAKQGPQLIKTIQMPLYAKYGVTVYPTIDRVRISHVYMQTKGKLRSQKSTALLERDQIEKRWEEIESHVRTLKDVVKASKPGDVPPNLKACPDFRGCHHRGGPNCPMSQTQTINQIFGITKSEQIRGNETMSLMDEINNLKAQQAAATTQTAPAPEPQHTQGPSFAEVWAIIEAKGLGIPPLKDDAAQAFAAHIGADWAPGQAYAGQGSLGTFRPLNMEELIKVANNFREDAPAPAPTTPDVAVELSITPPNEPAPAPVVADVAPPQPAPTPEPTPQPAPVEMPATAPETPATVASVPAGAPECYDKVLAAHAKGKFGPCKKPELVEVVQYLLSQGGGDSAPAGASDVELDTANQTIAALRAELDSAKANLGAAIDGAPATDAPKVTVYIDAAPSCPSDRLDDYVRHVCGLIEQQCSVKDIRCNGHEALAYGQWKGALAACVREVPLNPGVYTINTYDEITEIVANTLCESADVWVRGVK